MCMHAAAGWPGSAARHEPAWLNRGGARPARHHWPPHLCNRRLHQHEAALQLCALVQQRIQLALDPPLLCLHLAAQAVHGLQRGEALDEADVHGGRHGWRLGGGLGGAGRRALRERACALRSPRLTASAAQHPSRVLPWPVGRAHLFYTALYASAVSRPWRSTRIQSCKLPRALPPSTRCIQLHPAGWPQH